MKLDSRADGSGCSIMSWFRSRQKATGHQPVDLMYVLSPVSTYQSEDYEASGFKAEKKKCLSADVWKDFTPGDRVRLFFDDKKRVVMYALDQ